MPITLKKDEWKVKDPSSGNYRGAAILSTTLPEDAVQIIEDTQNALDAEEIRAGQIISDAQNAVDGIEGQSSLIQQKVANAVLNGNNYELIDTAVESWLDAHPEATTTVQDHSLTYEKLVNGTLGYITPEMFGAIGDGETDDTAAWQAAVDFGLPILATKNIYRCGQINVKKNIVIDCNNASFVSTEPILFKCDGTVTKTLNDEADYIAYADYSLSENYTGFAMLQSPDNIVTVRDYYRGGFVTQFSNGKCYEKAPVSFGEVSVLLIDPITCSIVNVGNVTYSEKFNYNYTVYCKYGYNCLFDNFLQSGEKFNIITLDCCSFCTISRVTGNIDYTGADPNFYALQMLNSSYNRTINCDIHCSFWHCWTTGGIYLCLNNNVNWCRFTTDSMDALSDHANAIGTIVQNSEISCLAICGNGKVENVTILPTKTSKGSSVIKCNISFMATNLEVGNFYVDSVYMKSTGSQGGQIDITSSAAVKSNFIINNIILRNVHMDAYGSPFGLYVRAYSSTVNNMTFKGKIVIDNVDGDYYVNPSDMLISFDSSSALIVKNCSGIKLAYAADSLFPSYVEVIDSKIELRGNTFSTLRLVNVKKLNTLSYIGRIKATNIIGYNIDRLVAADLLLAETVEVYNMSRWNEPWLYAIVNSTVGNICGVFTANGIVNKAIAD